MHSSSRNPGGMPLQALRQGAGLFDAARVYMRSDPSADVGGLPSQSTSISTLDELHRAVLAPDWCAFSSRDAQLTMLKTYLTSHFIACVEQGKVVQHLQPDGVASWAVFNTSLLMKTSEEPIYAVLSRLSDDHVPWQLHSWVPECALTAKSQPWNQQHTLFKVPSPAQLIPHPSSIVFTPSHPHEEFRVDEHFWETVDNLVDTLPEALQQHKQLRRLKVEKAMQRGRKHVQYNPSIATPQYCNSSQQLQLLLPLKLEENSNTSHLALVLAMHHTLKGERLYTAVGVQHLLQSYMNARIVMPVNQLWLVQGAQESEHLLVQSSQLSCEQKSMEQHNKDHEKKQHSEREHPPTWLLAVSQHPSAERASSTERQQLRRLQQKKSDDGNSSGSLSWGDEMEEETALSTWSELARDSANKQSDAVNLPAQADSAAKKASSKKTLGPPVACAESVSSPQEHYDGQQRKGCDKPRWDRNMPDAALPKLNIPVLPESFVEDMLYPTNTNASEHPATADAEAAVAEAVQQFGEVRSVFVREHKQREGRFFAIVDLVEWSDTWTRDYLLKYGKTTLNDFYDGDAVLLRRHMDRQDETVANSQSTEKLLAGESQQRQSSGPPTRSGWSKTKKTTRDGKTLYRGQCTSCGFVTEVPFRPVSIGQPPCCKACIQQYGQAWEDEMGKVSEQSQKRGSDIAQPAVAEKQEDAIRGTEDEVRTVERLKDKEKERKESDGDAASVVEKVHGHSSSSGDETEAVPSVDEAVNLVT